MTQHITNAEIVAKNRAALLNGTLGAKRGHRECMYNYGDGSRCAVGVCLDKQTVYKLTTERYNECSVHSLLRSKKLRAENPEVLKFTQKLHDNWARGQGEYTLDAYGPYDDPNFPFLGWITPRFNRKIDESLFSEWLNHVETLT